MNNLDAKERNRLLYVWSDMKRRCHRENHHAYANYGGRGITVCERWRNSFAAFLEDMGPRPDPKLTLERVNNDAGYGPDNCIWATRLQQSLNKRMYRSNTSGERNIALEVKTIKGKRYEYWRLRIRRGGKIVTNRRFKSLEEAVLFRDKTTEELGNGRA